MAEAHQIIDLRKLIAERFPSSLRSQKAIFQTGIDSLDQLSGGLPRSALSEVTNQQLSAGSASLIHQLLQNAAHQNQFTALIDGADSFDPQSLPNDCLQRLLWVRCSQTLTAMKSADLLLRDGNFPLVILDLVLNPAAELGKIPPTSWYRLQRLVEVTSTVCLVLTRKSIVSSAQLKLSLENGWTLQDLAGENPGSQVRFQLRRSHVHSEIRHLQSAVS